MKQSKKIHSQKIRLALMPIVIIILIATSFCSKHNNGTIKAPGIVDGDIITVKTPVAGTIQQLNIADGDKITKGQLLALVNPDKVQNQLKDIEINSQDIDINSAKLSSKLQYLQSNIAYLKKQVERFKRLKEKNAIPGDNLETMELKLKEAETTQFETRKTLESLKVQKENLANKKEYLGLTLKDHSITSPVDGVVIEKFVSEGEQIFTGTAIADIMNLSSLYIELFIEENEMGKLRLNQQTTVTIDGVDKTLTGTVTYFGKKAEFSPKYIVSEKERKSLLYQVKVKATDPEGLLKLGMPVTVEFK